MGLRMRRSKVPAPPPACPLTECMSLLGGAWTPNVIWYLSACPRRFGELRADIPLVSAKVLTARLRALESKGVVNRRVVASSPPSVEYSLTDLGRELIPVIHAIIDVGERLKADAAKRVGARRAAGWLVRLASGIAADSRPQRFEVERRAEWRAPLATFDERLGAAARRVLGRA